jgi:hypothetical protein
MAKTKSTTETAAAQDAKQLTFEEIFEIVVSNFGHVHHEQVQDLFELLNTEKK